MKDMQSSIFELCSAHGVSGFEEPVRETICGRLRAHGIEYDIDDAGNVLVFRRGKSRREAPLMVMAAMDEAGLYAGKVNDDGSVAVSIQEGMSVRTLMQRGFISRGGIRGAIGLPSFDAIKPAARAAFPEADKLTMHIGAASGAEAEAMLPLDEPFAFDSISAAMGSGLIRAKALANRAACAVMLELIYAPRVADTWFVFTAKSRLGGLGALEATRRIVAGQVLVLEAVQANDMPATPPHHVACRLGAGAVLSQMDTISVLTGAIYSRSLYRAIAAAGSRLGILWQYGLGNTANYDAYRAHLFAGGAEMASIGIPVRYMDTACSMASLADTEQVLRLAAAAIDEVM